MNIQQYIFNIGSLLSQLGNELQMQAQSSQPLNIHSQVKQTMDNLIYYLHNLNADLDACRYNLIKDGKSEVNTLEMESLKVALHHLLKGESYIHNGETSNPATELYKMKFLIDSLYRLTTKGVQGSTEYIFGKISKKNELFVT